MLFQRFQGAWMGVLLGEALATCYQQTSYRRYQPIPEDYCSPSQVASIAIAMQMLQLSTSSPGAFANLIPEVSQAFQVEGILAQAVLVPMGLLYGDEPTILMHRLQQWDESLGIALQEQGIVAHCLALLLHDRCPPQEILSYLSRQPTYPDLPSATQILPLVSDLLNQSASLTTAQLMLHGFSSIQQTMALALYCFLSTPGDSRLCLERAIRCLHEPLATAAIVGMLSGAHMGMIGFPIEWRQRCYGLTGAAGLDAITQLFARWCGISNGRSLSVAECMAIPVASPGGIRSVR
jgi:hypothetical protein